MKKNNLANRLACELDMLTEIQPLQSLVEIYGNQRVLIEHHQGIRVYTRERIVVCTRYNGICVEGCNLRIVQMTKERLVIQGQIFSVKLSKEG